MPASVRIVWDRAQIKALKTDPEVVAFIREIGQDFARHMRTLAPERTGAGARSIQPRDSRSKGAQDVGWDKDHYYMYFQEFFSTFGHNRIGNPNFQFGQRALESYIHT